MVGVALYGFAQASVQALSLTYLMDSYAEVYLLCYSIIFA
jgi:hypothetical protein